MENLELKFKCLMCKVSPAMAAGRAVKKQKFQNQSETSNKDLSKTYVYYVVLYYVVFYATRYPSKKFFLQNIETSGMT